MSRFVVKNMEVNTYLCDNNKFSRNTGIALFFPTYKKAQKEAKRLNKQTEKQYTMFEDAISMKGKSCTKYQPVRLD